MRSLGICIGATTISLAGVRKDAPEKWEREFTHVQPHHGNPREAFLELIRNGVVAPYDRLTVTGRKFRSYINLPSISEPEAVETALMHLNGRLPVLDAVVSAGGETFMVYVLGRDGRIASVRTGNKCASGTGEFFMQQLRRLGVSLEEAMKVVRHETPYRVSGRCSVFCKSDCTHATNKGVPKGRIVAGLCEMMAGKILEMLRQVTGENIMLIGGTAQNGVVLHFLRREIKNLIVPEEAPYFEALGAALWTPSTTEEIRIEPPEEVIKTGRTSFSFHPPLTEAADLVEFHEAEWGTAQKGDLCILGLDVGSTTTKAVVMRQSDHRILASVYLRTQGDPVGASRACYAALAKDLGRKAAEIKIVALGVTGSGRQIAGLHAMTRGITNEIIAHASAALFFDPHVDTIFEIGGQDAKYTYIRGGIPADYAMNDACSAGTGSFLEEAAKETMGVETERIGELALRGLRPPNFNDQCAAFVSSDIKNAIHEGISTEDILAGLVYSVGMNYINRVKGNRPVGHHIFMQGGVCYNKAVPMAMAMLTKKKIIVPPDPGLMGAFGVALEMEKWLHLGLIAEETFSLPELSARELAYKEPFICNGGREGCDRKCEIARIVIDNRIYPFGGACNKWYNARNRITVETGKCDLVQRREEIISRRGPGYGQRGKTIGINRSFHCFTYLPFYRHFFSTIGFDVLIPDHPDSRGCDLRRAPFCYPAELAHGFFSRLMALNPDYIFLPHVKGAGVDNDTRESKTCPLSQGEPYYLRSAFKHEAPFVPYMKQGRILSPIVDFSLGWEAIESVFVNVGKALGVSTEETRRSYREAVAVEREAMQDIKDEGSRFLTNLRENPSLFGVVILGRSYNALTSEANKGIPHKFASRGIPVLPLDSLSLEDEEVPDTMYWSTGRNILKATSFIARTPFLFPCYITNFSCGPDSFLLSYFAHRMGGKPYLILELDSHVADAGLETRIEAFLDIIRNYRELEKRGKVTTPHRTTTRKAHFDYGRHVVIDRQGRAYPLTHPRVHLVMPPMGSLINAVGTAIFRSRGMRATPLPAADDEVLKWGRGHTSCKECLPLIITVGSLMKYLQEREDKDEIIVYFMPTASGPCRFGQYSPFTAELMEQLGIENVVLYSIHAEDGYSRHIPKRDFTLSLWSGVVICDILLDLYSLLYTNAIHRDEALALYRREVAGLIEVFERAPHFGPLTQALKGVLDRLRRIPLTRPPRTTPTVLVTGEIYVRHDDLSRRFLIEVLGDEGFACKVSSMLEWVYYSDYCFRKGWSAAKWELSDLLRVPIRYLWMKKYERAYKRIAASSGLLPYRMENVQEVLAIGEQFINPALTGEAILTVGASLAEVPHPYCGAIAIGPFGCMPNRLSEAILSVEMGEGKPFLAIESDGNPFPQIITARLEVFLLQARRVFEAMMARSPRPVSVGGTA